jgi:hypothetical protein
MTTRFKVTMAAAAAALLALSVGVTAGSAQAAPTPVKHSNVQAAGAVRAAPTANTYTQSLVFNNAFNTHTFVVTVGSGGNIFTASSQDCCIAGDHWGVVVDRFGGVKLGQQNPIVAACGDGNTSTPSGFASLSGSYLSGKAVQVIIVHCSGVSTFPAGLTIFFSSNANITVVEKT